MEEKVESDFVCIIAPVFFFPMKSRLQFFKNDHKTEEN